MTVFKLHLIFLYVSLYPPPQKNLNSFSLKRGAKDFKFILAKEVANCNFTEKNLISLGRLCLLGTDVPFRLGTVVPIWDGCS